MNKKQKAVIWVALGLFAMTLFNAPWHVVYPDEYSIHGHRRAGHQSSEVTAIWNAPSHGSLRVGALFVEWIGIAVVSGVLLFLFKKPKNSN